MRAFYGHQARLSDSIAKDVSARDMKFGIAVAEWNKNITEGLFKGALNALINFVCEEKNIVRKNATGSFALPLALILF